MTGPVDYVYWMMNGQPLPRDNTTDFVMTETISFKPVEQNDTGSYECVAINAANTVTSPPYMLVVNCEYNIYKINVTVNDTI